MIAGVLLGIGVVAMAGVSTPRSPSARGRPRGGAFLRTGPELNTQIAISALLVVIVTRNADAYAVERIWETGVGSVVSLAVAAFVLPPDPLAESERRLAETAALAADLAGAGRDAHARRSLGARPARARRGARARRREGRRGPAARSAGPAHESAAPCLAPRLEVVELRQRMALRLAIQVRRLARDLASFAHRDDLRDEWDEAARRLPPIIGLVAAASEKALAGEGCSHEVAAARELMAAYQREDSRPIAAILRRPLVLLLDELSGPPA